MTSSRQFAPHLPDLRRYARAISNSEASAEAIVYAALASLVEINPGAVAGFDARLAMFRTAHRIWARLARSAANQDGADALPSWPPLEWATFLLATMESFTPSETAVITGQSIVDVEATLRRWVHAAVASDCFGRPPRTETDPRCAFIQGWLINEQSPPNQGKPADGEPLAIRSSHKATGLKPNLAHRRSPETSFTFLNPPLRSSTG